LTTINRNPYLVGQIALAEGLLTLERLEKPFTAHDLLLKVEMALSLSLKG